MAEVGRLVDELTAAEPAAGEFAGVGVEAYPKSVVPIIVPAFDTAVGEWESANGGGAMGIRAAVDTAACVQYAHRERGQADVARVDGTRPLCDRLSLVL